MGSPVSRRAWTAGGDVDVLVVGEADRDDAST